MTESIATFDKNGEVIVIFHEHNEIDGGGNLKENEPPEQKGEVNRHTVPIDELPDTIPDGYSVEDLPKSAEKINGI